MSRVFQCKNNPNSFCYICAQYVLPHLKRKITDALSTLFYEYFNFTIDHQDETWVPHTLCSTCERILRQWKQSNGKTHFSFAVPARWTKVVDHEQCFFCKIDVSGVNRSKRRSIVYPNVSSVKLPLPLAEGEKTPLPVLSSLSGTSSAEENPPSSACCSFIEQNVAPKFTQQILNDLVRNLDLSKRKAGILAQTLYDLKMLGPDCNSTFFRDREKDFSEFFQDEKLEEVHLLTYCKDIE